MLSNITLTRRFSEAELTFARPAVKPVISPITIKQRDDRALANLHWNQGGLGKGAISIGSCIVIAG